MAWLFSSAAPAASAAAIPAGAATIAAPAAGAAGAAGTAAGMGAPAAAGMSAINAASPGMLGGIQQLGQGLGQGAFGLGQAPSSWQGQLGAFLGQQGRQGMPTLPSMGPPQQIGQQPLGSMFQRPSQQMNPQLLQQIGLMLLGLQR